MAISSLRVLNIEDSERDHELFRRYLTANGIDLIADRVETVEAAERALTEHEWDLIICDYSMPHFSAAEALKLTRRVAADVPFIIISGTVGEEEAVKALKAGANDYLMKDNLTRLIPAIEREMEDAENRRARREAEESLRRSEAELRALFGAMNDVILVLDRDGRHLKMAPSSPKDSFKPLVGKTLHESYDAETADLILTNIQRVLDNGQTQRLECRLKIDGSEACYEASISPMSKDAVILIARDITDRKKADEKLVESERQLAEAQRLARVGSWNWDLKTNILSWSDEHYRIFGLKPSEINIGYESILTSYIHEEDRELMATSVERTRTTGEPYSIDYRVVRADGAVRVVHSIGNLASDEHKNPIRMFGTVQDVTEMRAAEDLQLRLNAQLEDERRRLNNIVANVPGVVWESWVKPDIDKQRINFVSEYVESMLGYSVEEWLAQENFWVSIVHPEDRGSVERFASGDLVAENADVSSEFRWIAKDGDVVWVQSNWAIVSDDEGRFLGLRGVTLDITERKRSEEEFIRSEERYRDLVENAHDIIYSHDLQGNYISINEAGENITGYTREEAQTMNMTEIVAPEFVETAKEMMQAKLRGEESTAYELELLGKYGDRVSVEVNSKLIKHGGVPVGVQGIARDISSRKRLEEQLRQAQKLESVGRLAGGIAHDFNNMLTAINGYSDLTLRQLPADHRVRRNIEEIKKAGERSALLTNQLLAFSRRQMLQPEVVDLNHVISETTTMLKRVIGEDIELVTELDPKVGNVSADKGQLSQIIMNLTVNARDAMSNGGKLTITTSNTFIDPEYARKFPGLLAGAYVQLVVSDTGTGIKDSDLQHIFEPFFTTKEVGKGTGLGLATVYGIIKQSGGSINVMSKVGAGTTFEILLPRVGEEGTGSPAVAARENNLPIGRETILLVEDEDLVRSFLSQLLDACGYKVIATADGASAIDLCRELTEPIDLLITDVVMPQMSGRELAEELTELLPGMPVIFISGYTDDELVRESVLDSGVIFIQKPFTLESISRRVRGVLDEHKRNPR